MQWLLHATKAKLPHGQSHQLHLHSDCYTKDRIQQSTAPRDNYTNDGKKKRPLMLASTSTANKVAATDLALAVVNDLLVAEVGVHFHLQHCRLDTGVA